MGIGPRSLLDKVLPMQGPRLVPFADDFERANGLVNNGWTGSTWRISSGVVVNSQLASTELLTDGGLENWNSPTDLTDWSEIKAGTSSVNQEGTTKHGGSYSARLDIDASTSAATIYQTGTQPANTEALFNIWMYVSGAGAGRVQWGAANYKDFAPGASWTNYIFTLKSVALNDNYTFSRGAGSASQSIYYDDLSVKLIPSTALYLVRPITNTNVIVSAALTYGITAGFGIAGIGIFDSETAPSNYLMAYWNGSNLKLSEYISDVENNLINGVVTWVEGELPEIRISGTTAQLWYRGAQVGTDQTINALIQNCKRAGLYSNHPTPSFGSFSVTAND